MGYAFGARSIYISENSQVEGTRNAHDCRSRISEIGKCRASALLADCKANNRLIQAELGLSSITGGPAESWRVGISIVDIAIGATAYSAILEALITHAESGDGADIRASTF